MKEKVMKFYRENQLVSGLILGVLICLLLIGCFRLIASREQNQFKNAAPVLKEDYLRLTIDQFSITRNDELAKWRFGQLKKEGQSLLKSLEKDPLTDPLSLLEFSRVVGADSLWLSAPDANDLIVKPTAASEPSLPEKGMSAVGTILILLFVFILIGLFALFFLSGRKTELIQEWKDAILTLFHRVFPPRRDSSVESTAVHEEKRFPFGDSSGKSASQDESANALFKISKPIDSWDDVDEEVQQADDLMAEAAAVISRHPRAIDYSIEPDIEDEADEELAPDDEWEAESLIEPVEPAENGETCEAAAADVVEEKVELPFVPMLVVDDTYEVEPVLSLDEDVPDEEEVSDELTGALTDDDQDVSEEENAAAEEDDVVDVIETPFHVVSFPKRSSAEPLIHYQTIYKLGDDYFDETFSLDDENEQFIGECGIGIAETLNNTDPKAVTAFEIWLFDRDDVTTPTSFLLSDFAYGNEEMIERLKNQGNFDRIAQNHEYEVIAHSLRMIVKITDLAYGTESSDKRSYFDRVAFDVRVYRNG